MVAWGFALVLADFRIGTFDLLPDVVGWTMCLVGLLRWAHLSGWFRLATFGGLAGLVAAVAEFLTAPDGTFVTGLGTVAATALVFGTCTGLIATVGDPARRRTAEVIRWADLGLTVLLVLLVVVGLGEIAVLLVLPALAVAVWFAVFVHGCERALLLWQPAAVQPGRVPPRGGR